ncbi:MAG: carbohydrate-binding family 9-like protein, partial [Nannocystaceae bacterium]
SFTVRGAPAGLGARVGLRAPRSAARQQVRPSEAPPDPRDQEVAIELADGPQQLRFVVPEPWHPRSAVIDLEARRGDDDRVAAIRGPRREDGRAFLAVVPVVDAPTQIVAPRMVAPILDGVLTEWSHPPTPLVESLHGEPTPPSATEVWFGWDDDHLYVAGAVVDADLYSTYTAQDEPLYRQEALEVFLAGTDTGRRYLELQASARGVTFDARFPTYRKGDEAWDSRWRIGVHAEGTLDGPVDHDEGWALEAAIPWAEICEETDVTCPVGQGTILRVNVFRLDKPDRKGSQGWALSPTRTPDFHNWANAAVLELR